MRAGGDGAEALELPGVLGSEGDYAGGARRW